MKRTSSTLLPLAFEFASAWDRLERSLDGQLSSVRGISFAEFRLLRALADAPESQASRVDLAASVGLTASGVTRALQPLEKLKIVKTRRSDRDARLALATLTKAGAELVEDASGVVEDALAAVLVETRSRVPKLSDLVAALRG